MIITDSITPDTTRVCLPSLGANAPNFTANTTYGPISLDQYKGKWVILFSHPGDFTPVCTTEFLAFSKAYDHFVNRNTQLLGISVDSNPSHIAWCMNIYKSTGIQIPFPIIDDRSMEISKEYGMISKDVSKYSDVRAVFFIDPKQKIRAIMYYPLTNGRNIAEILRLLDSLQFTDANNLATPANWVPGRPAIVPMPKTFPKALEVDDSPNCLDWYLCFTKSQDAQPEIGSPTQLPTTI